MSAPQTFPAPLFECSGCSTKGAGQEARIACAKHQGNARGWCNCSCHIDLAAHLDFAAPERHDTEPAPPPTEDPGYTGP